jgi:hypothetical protein
MAQGQLAISQLSPCLEVEETGVSSEQPVSGTTTEGHWERLIIQPHPLQGKGEFVDMNKYPPP